MKYKLIKSAPTGMNNFIGIEWKISPIDGNEPYPVTSKIYKRQDGTFQVEDFGHVTLEELEQIFETFMYCEEE